MKGKGPKMPELLPDLLAPIKFKKNENSSPSQVNNSNIERVVQCICTTNLMEDIRS